MQIITHVVSTLADTDRALAALAAADLSPSWSSLALYSTAHAETATNLRAFADRYPEAAHVRFANGHDVLATGAIGADLRAYLAEFHPRFGAASLVPLLRTYGVSVEAAEAVDLRMCAGAVLLTLAVRTADAERAAELLAQSASGSAAFTWPVYRAKAWGAVFVEAPEPELAAVVRR